MDDNAEKIETYLGPHQPVLRGVTAVFARDVLQRAAQIAMARATCRPRPSGPPLSRQALLTVDSTSTKLGLKSKLSFVTHGHVVHLQNEQQLPQGSIVIYAEDIWTAIRDLGLDHHVKRDRLLLPSTAVTSTKQTTHAEAGERK